MGRTGQLWSEYPYCTKPSRSFCKCGAGYNPQPIRRHIRVQSPARSPKSTALVGLRLLQVSSAPTAPPAQNTRNLPETRANTKPAASQKKPPATPSPPTRHIRICIPIITSTPSSNSNHGIVLARNSTAPGAMCIASIISIAKIIHGSRRGWHQAAHRNTAAFASRARISSSLHYLTGRLSINFFQIVVTDITLDRYRFPPPLTPGDHGRLGQRNFRSQRLIGINLAVDLGQRLRIRQHFVQPREFSGRQFLAHRSLDVAGPPPLLLRPEQSIANAFVAPDPRRRARIFRRLPRVLVRQRKIAINNAHFARCHTQSLAPSTRRESLAQCGHSKSLKTSSVTGASGLPADLSADSVAAPSRRNGERDCQSHLPDPITVVLCDKTRCMAIDLRVKLRHTGAALLVGRAVAMACPSRRVGDVERSRPRRGLRNRHDDRHGRRRRQGDARRLSHTAPDFPEKR